MSYIGKTPTPAPLTANDIADGIITEDKLGANAVTTGKITDGTVAQADISDQAINEAKMQISNAPTNGYMLTAQSGNTGGMTWAEAGGGCWTKLDTITISGTTSQIEHEEANFTSTHRDYKIMLSNICVTADTTLRMRIAGDGASLETSSNYRFASTSYKSNNATNNQYNHGDSLFVLGGTSTGTSTAVFTTNLEINLYHPLSTSSYFTFSSFGHHNDDNDYTMTHVTAGTYTSAQSTAMKRIVLYMGSGDFSSGTSTLYGRVA